MRPVVPPSCRRGPSQRRAAGVRLVSARAGCRGARRARGRRPRSPRPAGRTHGPDRCAEEPDPDTQVGGEVVATLEPTHRVQREGQALERRGDADSHRSTTPSTRRGPRLPARASGCPPSARCAGTRLHRRRDGGDCLTGRRRHPTACTSGGPTPCPHRARGAAGRPGLLTRRARRGDRYVSAAARAPSRPRPSRRAPARGRRRRRSRRRRAPRRRSTRAGPGRARRRRPATRASTRTA